MSDFLDSRTEDIDNYLQAQLEIDNTAKQKLSIMLAKQSEDEGIIYSELSDSEKKKIFLSPKYYYDAIHSSEKVSDELFRLYLYSYWWIIWKIVKSYCWNENDKAELRQQAYLALLETFAEFENRWATDEPDKFVKFIERLQKNIKKGIKNYKEQFEPGFIADERQFKILRSINQIEESGHIESSNIDEEYYVIYGEQDANALTKHVNQRLNANYTSDTIKKVLQKRSFKFKELPIDISEEDYRIAGGNDINNYELSPVEAQIVQSEEQKEYAIRLTMIFNVLQETDKKILQLSWKGYDSKTIGNMMEPPMTAVAVRKRLERMPETIRKKLGLNK